MTKLFNFATGNFKFISSSDLVANEDCDQVKYFFKIAHEAQSSFSDY